jgi:UDP-N-acetylmuramoyl-L-alanyl-D-glutamate--2,6-diaminopimelate ligase
MRAKELADKIQGAVFEGADCEITGIADDTRKIVPGSAFIALKGTIADGHDFIESAIDNGASAIICSSGYEHALQKCTFIKVPDTRQALKSLLGLMFPSAGKIKLAGITGTSGKTTTTYLIESIIRASGRVPGVIGTIDIRYSGRVIPANVTTPGPVELYSLLNEMSGAGVDICAMEVSSHALDQKRIEGLEFAAGAFMNLSHEHLDYHKDMEEYYQAKKKLFNEYLNGKALINIYDEYGLRLASEIENALTFGFSQDADIRPLSMHEAAGKMDIRLQAPSGELFLESSLMGRFQAYNIMAATGVAMALGIDSESIQKGISDLAFVPGRMEPVPNSHGLTILVDYAHKPEALENALDAAAKLSIGKLVTIFGCGGDRDRTKRPLMAAIAEKYSDTVIVTSDNPRTEDPDAIIKEIAAGFSATFKPIYEPDRKKAIKLAISMTTPEDVLIIAGKGHEDYQIIGKVKFPFDDRAIVRQTLKEVL